MGTTENRTRERNDKNSSLRPKVTSTRKERNSNQKRQVSAKTRKSEYQEGTYYRENEKKMGRKFTQRDLILLNMGALVYYGMETPPHWRSFPHKTCPATLNKNWTWKHLR